MPKNLNQQDARTAVGTSFEAQPDTTSVEQMEVSSPSTTQQPSSSKPSTSTEAGNAKSEILTALNSQDDKVRKQLLKTLQKIEVDFKIEFVRVTKLSFKLSDSDRLNKDLSVVVYDYLYYGKEPDKINQEIIRKIWNPFARVTPSWLETCCQMLLEDGIFNEFYGGLLGSHPWSLKEIVQNNPDILMNELSDELLLKRLIDNLDYDYLHGKIMTSRNKEQQTVMFTTASHAPWVTLYREEGDGDPRFRDLFNLLNIRDVRGQTALHINPVIITQILKFRYTTIHHKLLMRLIEVENESGQKAINAGGGHELLYLREHLVENRYLLYGKPTVVIISILKGRTPGAQPEAESIHKAFKSLKRFETKLYQDQRAGDIMEIIEYEANRDEYPGVSPAAFIVVLMSHGLMGAVEDCDGAHLTLKDIEFKMCSVRLSGKPKILIAQCCQEKDENSDKQDDADPCRQPKNDSNTNASKIPYQPRSPDFCAIMSSVPGKTARRNKFIPEIAEKLSNLPTDKGTPIHKIFADAAQKLEENNIKQTPQILSLLTSEFAV